MNPTEKTNISRLAKRGNYEQETIYSILDEGLFCHISYSVDNQPFIIPTGYCRIDNKLYIHGSVGSHFLREIVKGIPVCVAVSLIDGLVLARSAFNHSVNYRSVVLFGKFELVEDEDEKWLSLKRFTEHMIKGRWTHIRQPNPNEMRKTMALSIQIEEASAKIRTGAVKDEEDDLDLTVWAGILPLSIVPQEPIADELMKTEIPVPDYISNYKR